MISIQNYFTYSPNIIKLFQKEIYESFILDLMSRSKIIFSGSYEAVPIQSHGECDFVDVSSGGKFDAKLPFYKEQIELLTNGNRHPPLILEWLQALCNETTEYGIVKSRHNPSYTVCNTELYKVISDQVLRSKIDENLIFFLPYPITLCIEDSIFLQFASDLLTMIYEELLNDIDLVGRKLYAIYPSILKNQFVLRSLGYGPKEFLYSCKLEKYFTYEAHITQSPS